MAQVQLLTEQCDHLLHKLFEYLIETHDLWLKCVWSEEGGHAGTYVGKKGEEPLNVIWNDWCLEEWAVRMSNTTTQDKNPVKKEYFYQTF